MASHSHAATRHVGGSVCTGTESSGAQAEDQVPAGPQGTALDGTKPALPQRCRAQARPCSGCTPWAGLGCRHHALLPVVHAPEAVKLGKVHIGLNAAILARRQRVGGPGAEEPPVGAGAAALGMRVGGLQGQRRALAARTTGERASQGPRLLAGGWGGPCLRPQVSLTKSQPTSCS